MYDLKNAEQINTGKKKPSELGVKALDDYTLQFELEKPIPYYKEMLAFGTFLPQNEKVVKNSAIVTVQLLKKPCIMDHLK